MVTNPKLPRTNPTVLNRKTKFRIIYNTIHVLHSLCTSFIMITNGAGSIGPIQSFSRGIVIGWMQLFRVEWRVSHQWTISGSIGLAMAIIHGYRMGRGLERAENNYINYYSQRWYTWEVKIQVKIKRILVIVYVNRIILSCTSRIKFRSVNIRYGGQSVYCLTK